MSGKTQVIGLEPDPCKAGVGAFACVAVLGPQKRSQSPSGQVAMPMLQELCVHTDSQKFPDIPGVPFIHNRKRLQCGARVGAGSFPGGSCFRRRLCVVEECPVFSLCIF